ncbi:SCP2 sterol-binding domain-containing protein [Rhodocista pekingensis]|uniref:SCP2 sterol-binding domain-containing protein n=1 Tax=Rhodocista pekingensis TaxID=201185 RepID=A0ABW2KNK7_9PROT
MSLQQILTEMQSSSSRFNGLNSTVKFDFGDQGSIFIDGTKTPPVITEGGEDAKCVLKISLEDFMKLQHGQLSPMMAFTMGKLKVQGDMGVAMKLSTMLDD